MCTKQRILNYNVIISPRCAVVSVRLASWMLTSVGPVSPACFVLAILTCISVTRDGCLSTQIPRRPSPSCLLASCSTTQMKLWCGGGLKKMVCCSLLQHNLIDVPPGHGTYLGRCHYWETLCCHIYFNICKTEQIHVVNFVFWIRFTYILLLLVQLWSASLWQMLRGGSWMCYWWTRHQGHLTNIWQCWRTLKNTAV